MKRLCICLCSLILMTASGVHAQVPTQRIRGEVILLDRLDLKVRSESGQVFAVTLVKDFRVSARSRADFRAIASGAYLGTTAIPRADGTLVATEVHVFPESMRGTGEGHRPMDSQTGSTMTNATVDNVTSAGAGRTQPRSTMTNATVADVTSSPSGAASMTLKYKGGEKVVIVPENVPVVMVEPGNPSMLVPGAHLVITLTVLPDGTLSADRLTVGKDGFAPPM